MKTLIAMVFSVVLFTTVSFAQEDWEWQYSTTTEDLNDVYFVNKDTGWVIGNNGIIINTIDGGENWYQQNSGTTNELKAVHFINDNVGWVVGKETMLYTEDGGLTWVKYFQGYIKDIYCIYFTDENHGWVCGSDSCILKTNNGGGGWEIIPSQVGKFNDIFFINDRLGLLHSRDDAGYIYMTEDGGYTLKGMARSRKSFKSFFFIDSNLGWACGGLIGETNKISGWVDISTDGADTWIAQFGENLVHSIHFFDEHHGIALGQRNRGILIKKIYDVFLKTVDGGQNWGYCEPGGNAFHFIDHNTGWIVGFRGKIYKTTTGGGILSISQEKNIKIKDFGLSQNYPNPFNPATTIAFNLPKPEFATLKVYNILGKEITTLVNKKLKAGNHTYRFNGGNLASGIYLYRLEAGEYQDVRKMILLR